MMTSEPVKVIEVFFSYAHKDERLRNELEKHLTILKRQGYRDLPMVGTESRNRNIAQKSHMPLGENLEKLFRGGRKRSKGATVALGNGFWEGDSLDTTMLYIRGTKQDLQNDVEKIAWT